MAAYVNCASHVLNVLNESSALTPISNVFDTISKVINFINESPKRKDIFHVNLITYCQPDLYVVILFFRILSKWFGNTYCECWIQQ